MDNYRKSLEDGSNELTLLHLAYIEGLGVTIDEYILKAEDGIYNMLQMDYFWQFILELYDDIVQAEAIRRDEDPNWLIWEFWDRYVDRLVENADIEILCPEIAELFR